MKAKKSKQAWLNVRMPRVLRKRIAKAAEQWVAARSAGTTSDWVRHALREAADRELGD